MKLTKLQLKEMIRQVVRKKLHEMDLKEKGVETEVSPEKVETKPTKDAEAQRKETQAKRQAMKSSARGMELECGHDMDRDEVDVAEEGDFLTKLEGLLLKNEQKGH